MRTLLIAFPALLIITGCPADLGDYCGEPAQEAASWDDGSEATAAEVRDGLLGLWVGVVSFDGVEEAMSLVLNDPTEEPSLITYPDAGDGHSNVQVSDACLDTLQVLMPAQLILNGSSVDVDFDLALGETGFSAGWSVGQDIEIPACSAEPCALHLSFERYNVESDEIIGKLRWVDTTVEDDGAQPISDPNVALARVLE